jgi:hypothetical protein
MTIKLPKITLCEMEECAYNIDKKCRAIAITIGGPEPECITIEKKLKEGGLDTVNGGVGACKARDCCFNRDLICIAKAIKIEKRDNKGYCKSYQLKSSGIEHLIESKPILK